MMTLDDIKKARERIAKHLSITPVIKTFDPRDCTNNIFLKLETFHKTCSFKERGALNAILQLPANGTKKLIAASAGNHSQAVSYHGVNRGYDVTICMPKYTPLTKVLATESWGAKVNLHGAYFSEAMQYSKELAAEQQSHHLHAFDDPHIMAGQGTVGLEILEQVPDIECVVIPIGGGGLASGTAVALKESNPKIKVIGVQAENCSVVGQLVNGVKEEDLVHSKKSTIGDGIAVKTIGQYTIPVMQKYLDDVVTVTEEEMAEAMMFILSKTKTLLEGAGAAAFAAILANKIPSPGTKTLAIASGGNVDVTLLSKVIQKSLVKNARQVFLELMISDRPGGLNELTSVLSDLGASILQIQHERTAIDVPFYETSVKLKLEIKGNEHLKKILNGLQERNYVVKHNRDIEI